MQPFEYLGSFEKKYIQEHANSHPQKSYFGPLKILFRSSRSPGTYGCEALAYRILIFAPQNKWKRFT